MKLFYKPGACSLACHITLRESELKFSLTSVDLTKKQLENGDDFLKINPKGQVPALLLNDNTLLTEGVAIMQYIADTRAASHQLLASPGNIARYRTLEWLNYVATELHKGFIPLFRSDTPDDYKPTVQALLEKKLRYVNECLQNLEWISGPYFTIADAYLFTVLLWARAMKLDISKLKNIEAYMARVAARPAVTVALAIEGLSLM